MRKQEKTFFVQNLTEELKSASSVVLVDYSGIGVKMQQDLRKRLSEVNAKMFVVKNTLFKLAGKAARVSKDVLSDTVLAGPVAVVITEHDPIAPLQTLGKFAKEFDIPQMKVGIIDGSFQDKDNLITLSKLPGKEALLAQAVGTIAQPMYGIVGVLNANMQRLVFILDKYSKSEARNPKS